jgi:hypothetical protein
MTDPAPAIRDEIRELIEAQVKTFGQPASLTPSELSECRCRAERIKLLGQELDRVAARAILEGRFGAAIEGRSPR